MFWAKCKYKAKPFIFFPPTMWQQSRPSFCLAVQQGCCGLGSEEQVYWLGIGRAPQVLPCHFQPYPSHLPQETALPLPEADSPWQEDGLLRQNGVKFTFLSLLYSSVSHGAVGYSMVFALCYRESLLLHHFSNHFVQDYFFLSPAQASLLSSLWSG